MDPGLQLCIIPSKLCKTGPLQPLIKATLAIIHGWLAVIQGVLHCFHFNKQVRGEGVGRSCGRHVGRRCERRNRMTQMISNDPKCFRTTMYNMYIMCKMFMLHACIGSMHIYHSITYKPLKHWWRWWSDWHDTVHGTSGVHWGTGCTGPCRTCLYHGTVWLMWLFCNWCIQKYSFHCISVKTLHQLEKPSHAQHRYQQFSQKFTKFHKCNKNKKRI